MRLLAVSDIHESTSHVPRLARVLESAGSRVDVVIVAGDVTRFKGVEVARSVLVSLRDSAGAPVLFVPGNCDSPQLLKVEKLADNIVNIHARAYRLGDLTFYGVGGGGLSPFYTPIEFTEEEFENFISNALNYSSERLVVVTHEPILGYFDDVNGVRIGSQVFASYLDRISPLLWITGHVHEKSGWTKVGRTTVVHPGPFMRGFYAIIDIVNSGVTVEVKRLPK